MREETYGLNLSRVKEPPSLFQCRSWVASLLILLAVGASAQNVKCKTIPTNVPVYLDSALVEPGSINVQSAFKWNDSTQIITVVNGDVSKIEVCYRVLSNLLTQPFQERDLSDYDDSGQPSILQAPNPAVQKEELFDFGGVQKYGAISRGVSFGNRQSLFVNSTLNLQMDGKLDENLNISAVITDQNVPYQPEGNTQQIRDFDNVFIKLYNDRFDVTVGDIVIQQPDEGYFLKYYKNVQGLQGSYRAQTGKWKHQSRVSGALSKGKFNSAVLEPIDGLNGPYKLRGPNGERFIIVLANSEKVFIDGKQMERGFDRDYVIDYNLGEITFNNHIVITQFTIIRVDFEYAEQFYSRSNVSAYQAVSNEKVSLYTNYYRERDNPNATLGFSVDENDLNQLRNIGDSVDQAFIAGFDSVQFSENRVLYAQKDTVDQDGMSHIIFEYSTNPNQTLFSATFSDVGFGNGDYVLSQTTANGRIYEWVSPQGNQPQGNYEPGVFIPLPNSRQMITVGGEVKMSEYESFKSEVAFSNTDQNLYSNIQDSDNMSKGYFSSFSTEGRSSFIPDYQWIGSASMEYDEEDFTFIDRYRSILFDRDWNYTPSPTDVSDDFLIFLKGGLKKNEANRIEVYLNRRMRSSFIDGWQQGADFNQETNNFKLVSSHFLLQNNQLDQKTSWLRTKSDLSYRKWKWSPGYVFEVDENEISRSDSVVSTLMNFKAHEFYVASTDSAQSTYRFGYQLRQDRLPVDGRMEDYLFSKNFRASYQRNGDKGSVGADFNYRKVEDALELNLGQNEVINGRLNWIQSFLDRSVRSNFSFSTGNSRELRREFIYLPVSTGEGTHTWRDTNGDGVQDLNEFFEAINPDERNYVKIFTPTDDYITSFQTFYLHTIDLSAPAQWRSLGGMMNLVSKLSANINLNVNFKTTSDDYSDRLNPFALNLEGVDVISAKDSKRYTLFYNRNGRGFAGDFTHQTSDNKQLLVQGFETREKGEWLFNAKVDLSAEYTLRISSSVGRSLNQSDFLDSRNFEIVSNSYRPQLIWQPTNVLRLIGSYEREVKTNEFTESSNEAATSQVYMTELTWNQAGSGSLRSTFSIVKIDFNGDPSSYLGYLLLDALQPGTNQTWQLNWQQRLSKGMQVSLLYNGRKSKDVEAIHTGSVQVTAFF